MREPWADERRGSPGGTKQRERNVGGRTDGFTRPAQDWEAAKGVDGRNRRSVWTIATQPFPDAHFATFSRKLIEPCILAGCPAGGVVLDPFFGSGTVGVVAARHGRRWLGIELNGEYVELARKRLSSIQPVMT